GLDDVIAKNGIGPQLSDAIGRGTVTAGLAHTFHPTFSTDLGQNVSPPPGGVDFKFRSGDFRQFFRPIRDRKTIWVRSESDGRRRNPTHADFVEVDSSLPPVSTLRRRRQSIEGSLIQKRDVSRLDNIEKIVEILLHGFQQPRPLFYQGSASEVFHIVRNDLHS